MVKLSIIHKLINMLLSKDNLFGKIFFVSSVILIVFAATLDFLTKESTTLVHIGIMFTVIASFFGMLNMIFAAKESIINYYFGIICVSNWLIYVIFWSPLIWDAMINVVYLMLDAYGLYYWLNPSKSQKSESSKIATTRNLRVAEYFIYLAIAILSVYIMTFIGIKFGKYYNGLQALTDAISTITAILAKYLTSRKVLQSWYLWIIVGVISIPLYLSVHSYTLAMAWFLYFLNSLYGLWMWTHNMKLVKQVSY